MHSNCAVHNLKSTNVSVGHLVVQNTDATLHENVSMTD